MVYVRMSHIIECTYPSFTIEVLTRIYQITGLFDNQPCPHAPPNQWNEHNSTESKFEGLGSSRLAMGQNVVHVSGQEEGYQRVLSLRRVHTVMVKGTITPFSF
jgi:hypothetical protein